MHFLTKLISVNTQTAYTSRTKVYLLCLLMVAACRAGKPVAGPSVLPVPQPTAFKYVFLLTKNEGEMLVDYDTYQDRVSMEQLDERGKWTAEEFKERLSRIAAGGILYVGWTRPTTALAEPGNCTVVVYSPRGRVRERLMPNFYRVRSYVDRQGQTVYEQSSNNYLAKPVRSGSRVEVIDRTTGQHFWFLFKFP